MTLASVIDEKLTVLLAGRAPADGDELAADLAWMIEQVDSAFPLPVVAEQVEDIHLARIMEAAGELPAPVTAPLAPVHASLFDRLRAGLTRKVASATLGLTAAFGGAAYAGVLPAPVQEAVSKAAALVGLELPNPADDDADQDSFELEGVGDDHQPEDDAEGSEPDEPRSESGTGSDDGLGSGHDDSDQEGDDDGRADDGAAPDDDDAEADGGERDGDERDGDEQDGEEQDGDDEADNDGTDIDEADEADEADNDSPDAGDPSDTEDMHMGDPDELDGPRDSGLLSGDEGVSDL